MDDVAGEPEVDEHSNETVHEPPHSGDYPAIGNSIGVGVEGAVEGDGRQVGGPDGLRRIDEESTGEAGETIANEVCGQDHEDWDGGELRIPTGTEAVVAAHSGIRSWKQMAG